VAIAFVQKTTGQATGTAPVNVTSTAFGSNPTIGNKLIAVVTSWASTGGSSTSVVVTDNKGNTWTKRDEFSGVSPGNSWNIVSIWECTVATTGAGFTVTSTSTGGAGNGQDHTISITEFSGLGAYDKGATGSANTQTSLTVGPTGTLASANSLAVASINYESSGNGVIPTGWTNIEVDNSNNFQNRETDYQILSSNAAVSITWSGISTTFSCLESGALSVWSAAAAAADESIANNTQRFDLAGDDFVDQATAVAVLDQSAGPVGLDLGAITFDPADLATHAGNIALSNNNLTATATSSTGGSYTRATQSAGSGKYYIEWRADTVTSGAGPGIVNASAIAYIGADANGTIATYSNSVINNGSTLGSWTAATPVSGDVISMAWDCGAKLVWFRLNNGNWNNNVSANPATGVGGYAMPATGPWYPAFDIDTTGNVVTMRVLSTSWTQSPPSGFVQFGTSAAADESIVKNTQVFDLPGDDFADQAAAVAALDVSSFLIPADVVAPADESIVKSTLPFDVDDLGLADQDLAAQDLMWIQAIGFDLLTGSLAATEAQDVASFTASVISSGTLAATEAQDTASFSATLLDYLTLTATEAQDTASFAGQVISSGTLAATEAQDTASFTGTVTTVTTGTLAATEAQDTAAFTGGVTVQGTLAATEAQDTTNFSATLLDYLTLSATEAQDVAAFSAAIVASGTLAATEAPDTASMAASVGSQGSLSAIEAQDTASVSATLLDYLTLSATEAQDTASFTVLQAVTGVLNATDAQDIASFITDGAVTSSFTVGGPYVTFLFDPPTVSYPYNVNMRTA
jgi:hypothetical protein